MPGVAARTLQHDVRDTCADAERLTGKLIPKCMTNGAAAAVGADQVPRANRISPCALATIAVTPAAS